MAQIPIAMVRSSGPTRGSDSRGWRVTPYLFVAPFLALFVLFVVVPIGAAAWASLHAWSLGLPNQPFVGLENYADLFGGTSVLSVEFWKGMKATGLFTLLSVPLLVIVPLALALLLNQKFPGRTFFRAAYFAPYVLGVAVIGLLWHFLLDRQLGPVNQILRALGLGGDIAWTTSLPAGWVALVGATIWWTCGFNAVIYLAALQNVPEELYEAVKVDGGGAWRRFTTVTLPSIARVLQFVVAITIIASANMYGQSALITQQQPGTSTRTAIGFIAQTGIQGFNIGASSAMSIILALSLMVVSGLVLLAFRKVGDSDS
ncbi:binding-protein-dependent transport systems inner membrane component [Beutenbergia cavernae DSM 12333]|uniref:Binding-protein-dependent transport systems inner membrane component n=1 Tax=Beutenbergia cavernae (strain ATCC BAA-8 / DSM 12333 / CCUG 43141 / JCM 11478 / NBRC 16432 / NCIMB 13614 / HKI 0122) TaxID=471853 RepID=C5BVK4_BEUC1|nr:sugar ABC transporter permease [Beutenbergia cavernae]ACQ78444.1 binding-protein-dependent transport systems inner membrane component [Beutenbergia cavernae DSM 12333]